MNTSSIPAFGVKGKINFESISMPIKFLYWGKIKEQGLREAMVDIPVKAELAGGTYPFALTVSDENGDLKVIRKKLIVTLPEKAKLILNYKIVKIENTLPDKSAEKYLFFLRVQNESEKSSTNNECILENLRKEAYSLIEVLPYIQNGIPIGKNETIEIKYDITVQKPELFKDQLPFRLHFHDLTSRQQIQTIINLKRTNQIQAPIKDFSFEVLPSSSLGPILLPSSDSLKLILNGKENVKSVYVLVGNKKIFYKKFPPDILNEKEAISIVFPRTIYPTLYSIFTELIDGSLHEKIVWIQTINLK